MQRYPAWLKKAFSPHGVAQEVRSLIDGLGLATVCESAVCPNLRECYSQRQLSFMILGERCTRSCRFCAVDHGRGQPPDVAEPHRVAEAVQRLGLRHVVITSVARDDLRDEGAGHFVRVMQAVRARNPRTTIEVLVPDFHAREELVAHVLEAGRPEVFAHNVETVERLSPMLRPQAGYGRSLQVLRMAAARSQGVLIKSGLMVGLGELEQEVLRTLDALRAAGVTHLTLGQYLRPDADHLPVMEYLSPARFERYERAARSRGFHWVRSGPFVRSSYHAVEAIEPERLCAGSGGGGASQAFREPAGVGIAG